VTEIVAWQVKSKELDTWGPPIQRRKIAKQLERKYGYELRDLIVKEPFDAAKQRAKFEKFMSNDLLFTSGELAFNESRNCYVDYRIHLAWQCWREALQ
jgi:hypothetical protein